VSAKAPRALLELQAVDAEHADEDDITERGNALDTLVEDAWTRVDPNDQRWSVINSLLIDRADEAPAFLAAADFGQRLILLFAELHRQHIDHETGASWVDVRRLDAMQAELGEVIGRIKDVLAEETS
jgi:hypothetical protein